MHTVITNRIKYLNLELLLILEEKKTFFALCYS